MEKCSKNAACSGGRDERRFKCSVGHLPSSSSSVSASSALRHRCCTHETTMTVRANEVCGNIVGIQTSHEG